MIVALVAVAAGAVAQSVAGFGFALICGPALLSLLGPVDGLRLILTLSSVLNVVMLLRTFRDVRLRDAALMAAPGLGLTPLLVVAVRHEDKHILMIIAGALTLACAAALATGLHASRLRGPGGAVAAGAISAVMNVLGGLSGPSVALYAVNARWPESAVKPTLQAFGLALNVVALVSLGSVAVDWRAGCALVAGFGVGTLLAGRMAAGRTRIVILAVAVLGGGFAIARGLGA